MVTTRRRVLALLRKHPGSTVADLAGRLGVTGMAVRRHLEALLQEGLVRSSPSQRCGVGRPPTAWSLSEAGLETFPRRYDALAVELLDDLDTVDPEAVTAAFRCRTETMACQYGAALEDREGLEGKVAGLAGLRDEAGYLADWRAEDDGTLILTEHNCAVHRVAERHPVVCASELSLLRTVLGPDVDVDRTSHAMAGDACCAYRIRPRTGGADSPDPAGPPPDL